MKSNFFILLLIANVSYANIDKCIKKWNGQIPKLLSKTCLYLSIPHNYINHEVMAFTPKYPLYTDGMNKKRWIYLPNGTQIDNSDLSNWNFPKGTVLWKEFNTNGKKLETRMLYKTSEAPTKSSWQYATFLWRDDQRDADYLTKGASNVLGTIHDIPRLGSCVPCHMGNKDIVRGFDPIQLSFTDANAAKDEIYLKTLIKNNVFTHKMKDYYKIPAKSVTERKALGYMHGNCAHCHNENHGAGRNVGLLLKVKPTHKKRDDLDSIKTTINVHTTSFHQRDYRIVPNDPIESAIFHRLKSKTPGIMMAPIGRKTIDQYGVKTIEAWINSL